MKTYRINGSVVGGKYLGEVEAESAEEAIKKAYDELDISVSLCHFCSDECENADVESICAESDDGESATDADDLRARVAELEAKSAEIISSFREALSDIANGDAYPVSRAKRALEGNSCEKRP